MYFNPQVANPSQGLEQLSQILGVPLDSPVAGTKIPPQRLQLDEKKLEAYLNSLGMVDSGVWLCIIDELYYKY